MWIENVDGVDWYEAPAPLRWLPHRHKPQTRARIDGEYVERCRCGAFGPAPWFMLRPDKQRRRWL